VHTRAMQLLVEGVAGVHQYSVKAEAEEGEQDTQLLVLGTQILEAVDHTVQEEAVEEGEQQAVDPLTEAMEETV